MPIRPAGLILLFCWGLARAGTTTDGPPFRIQPNVIEMGAFYSGVSVKVEGHAQTGSKIIVSVVGPDCDESFNTKRRMGPIWLNAAQVRISNVPAFFFRFSSGEVRTLLSPSEIAAHRLDANSLARQIRTQSEETGANSRLGADYMELKRSEGSYRFTDEGVRMGDPGPEGTPFSVDFVWPRRARPATYAIHVYEVRDGDVARHSSAPMQAVRIGFPARLARFSEERASLYGIIAVAISALAGFGIDFVTTLLFGKKRATAH